MGAAQQPSICRRQIQIRTLPIACCGCVFCVRWRSLERAAFSPRRRPVSERFAMNLLHHINLLYVVLPSAVILLAAYFTYGKLLARLVGLDRRRKTPAYELQDGLDFEPL